MNLNQLTRIAKMSPHAKYQHCSIILAGNRLIAYGYNRKDLHAEIVAINRLNAWMRVSGKRPRNMHMINFMVKRKTGKIGNSRPCWRCNLKIYEAKIRYITYYKPGFGFTQGRYAW